MNAKTISNYTRMGDTRDRETRLQDRWGDYKREGETPRLEGTGDYKRAAMQARGPKQWGDCKIEGEIPRLQWT